MDNRNIRIQRSRSKESTKENNAEDFNKQVGTIIARLESLQECQPGPRLPLFGQSKKPDVRKSLIQTYLKEKKSSSKVTSTPCLPKNVKGLRDSPLDLSPIQNSNCLSIAEEIDENGDEDNAQKPKEVIEISDDSLKNDTYNLPSNLPKVVVKQEKASRLHFCEIDKQESIIKSGANETKEGALSKLKSRSRSKLSDDSSSSCNNGMSNDKQEKGKIANDDNDPGTFDSHDKSRRVKFDASRHSPKRMRTRRNTIVPVDSNATLSDKGNSIQDDSEIRSPMKHNVNEVPNQERFNRSNAILREINVNETVANNISVRQKSQKLTTLNTNYDSVSKANFKRHVGTSPPSFNRSSDCEKINLNQLIDKLTPFLKNKFNAVCKGIQTSNSSPAKAANSESTENVINVSKKFQTNSLDSVSNERPSTINQKSLVNNSEDLLHLKDQAHSLKLLEKSKKKTQADELDEGSYTSFLSSESSLHKCEIDHHLLFETLKNCPQAYWETRNDLLDTNRGSGRWRISTSIVPLEKADINDTIVSCVEENDDDHTLTPNQGVSENKIILSVEKLALPEMKTLTKNCKGTDRLESALHVLETDQDGDFKKKNSPKRTITKTKLCFSPKKTPIKRKLSVVIQTIQDKCTPSGKKSVLPIEPPNTVVSHRKAKMSKDERKSSLFLISPSGSFLASNCKIVTDPVSENEQLEEYLDNNVNNLSARQLGDTTPDLGRNKSKSATKNVDHVQIFSQNKQVQSPKSPSIKLRGTVRQTLNFEIESDNATTPLKKDSRELSRKSKRELPKPVEETIEGTLETTGRPQRNRKAPTLRTDLFYAQLYNSDRSKKSMAKPKPKKKSIAINKSTREVGKRRNRNTEKSNNFHQATNEELTLEVYSENKLENGQSSPSVNQHVENTSTTREEENEEKKNEEEQLATQSRQKERKKSVAKPMSKKKSVAVTKSTVKKGTQRNRNIEKSNNFQTINEELPLEDQSEKEFERGQSSPSVCQHIMENTSTCEVKIEEKKNEEEQTATRLTQKDDLTSGSPVSAEQEIYANNTDVRRMRRTTRLSKETDSHSVLPSDVIEKVRNVNCESQSTNLPGDTLSMDPMTNTNTLALDSVQTFQIDSQISSVATWNGAMSTLPDIYNENNKNRNEGRIPPTNFVKFAERDTLNIDQKLEEVDSGKYSMLVSQVETETKKYKTKSYSKTRKTSGRVSKKDRCSVNTRSLSRVKVGSALLEFMNLDMFNTDDVVCSDCIVDSSDLHSLQYVKIAPQRTYSSNSLHRKKYVVLEGRAAIETGDETRQLESYENISISPGRKCSVTNNGTDGNLLVMCHTLYKTRIRSD